VVAESKSGLEAVEVTKVFGDLTVLDRVSLAVDLEKSTASLATMAPVRVPCCGCLPVSSIPKEVI
jgi:hypothetical protein